MMVQKIVVLIKTLTNFRKYKHCVLTVIKSLDVHVYYIVYLFLRLSFFYFHFCPLISLSKSDKKWKKMNLTEFARDFEMQEMEKQAYMLAKVGRQLNIAQGNLSIMAGHPCMEPHTVKPVSVCIMWTA